MAYVKNLFDSNFIQYASYVIFIQSYMLHAGNSFLLNLIKMITKVFI